MHGCYTKIWRYMHRRNSVTQLLLLYYHYKPILGKSQYCIFGYYVNPWCESHKPMIGITILHIGLLRKLIMEIAILHIGLLRKSMVGITILRIGLFHKPMMGITILHIGFLLNPWWESQYYILGCYVNPWWESQYYILACYLTHNGNHNITYWIVS